MNQPVKRSSNPTNEAEDPKKAKRETQILVIDPTGTITEKKIDMSDEKEFDALYRGGQEIVCTYAKQYEISCSADPEDAPVNKYKLINPFHEEVIQGDIIICKRGEEYFDLSKKEWEEYYNSDHTEESEELTREFVGVDEGEMEEGGEEEEDFDEEGDVEDDDGDDNGGDDNGGEDDDA